MTSPDPARLRYAQIAGAAARHSRPGSPPSKRPRRSPSWPRPRPGGPTCWPSACTRPNPPPQMTGSGRPPPSPSGADGGDVAAV